MVVHDHGFEFALVKRLLNNVVLAPHFDVVGWGSSLEKGRNDEVA